MATKPPGGYSKTFKDTDNEVSQDASSLERGEKTEQATDHGQNVPPEAMPRTLKSAYAPEATPKPDEGFTPSHESKISSTSVDPPHPVLSQQAKDGTLADRNPPPEPQMGYVPLLAFRHRDADRIAS